MNLPSRLLSVFLFVLLICLSSCKEDVSSVYSSKNRVQCGFNGAAPPTPEVLNDSSPSEAAVFILDNTTHVRETLGSDGLEIQRRAGTAGEFEPLVSLNYRLGKSNSYLDKDVRKGDVYQYRMRTWRILNGEKVFSPWSKTVRIRL